MPEKKIRKKGVDFTGVSICYVCHDGQGNFLMHKRGKNCRDENGVWDTGGGGLEFGDTVEETLKKEIKEEFGTDVLDYEFIAYQDLHRKHNNLSTHWIILSFKVLIDKKKVKNNEPHKFDEIGWFTVDTLPEKIHSQLPEFFQKYRDKFI